MLNRINDRVKDISVPRIRIFANKVAQFENGINLTIGEPDFSTPELVKKAGMTAIQNNLTGYSHNAGLLELRESVANFFEDTYHFRYDPETEIVITIGASEGIDAVLRTILEEGDEVIIPAPIYSAYVPIVHLEGAKVVYLDTSATGFLPDPEKLEGLITEKTKAVILNYPSNPTGVTIPKERLDKIVDVLSKHEVFVISDEIYSENTFSGQHHSFAAYPELRNKLFLLHGLSKSHAMTGWRIGYVLGAKNLMEQVLKVHLHNAICASLPSQFAAIEALENCRDTPKEMNKAYIERRDYVQNRLRKMGLDAIQPTGAFYIFPSIKNINVSSLEFAEQLLEKEHVAVVPGSGFTKYGEGFIRISYANSLENLKEGLDRMENFIASIK
ncbi:aminotransferase class I/II-fold pyridoxal phosphate-dependent enzyme [Pseudogracilibacillus sp. SO30301A]|uniref:aminotransferase class I/II-fold pyridoxal phosphate-dependent enzyme n=1 Tax=Pseudogracilibacillus sp. SO30301A TaxID=3098291 RepID=UPI00300E40D9